VQRADVVVFLQPEAGADDDGLLADARVDAAAHAALAHQHAQPLVEGADELQPVEDVQELLVRQLELESLDGRHR
jgi:hypothetical protein